MRMKVLLSVISLLAFLPLQSQDIDFPLSQSEIEKYESRIRIQRLSDVNITHADAYRIKTQQPVYSPQTKRIVVDVINVNGPSSETMEKWTMGQFPLYRQSRLCWRRQEFIQR